MKEILTKIDSPDGEFHNGDPATGTQGTRVTAEWLNAVQERVLDFGIEVRYLLAKAAMTPDPQKQTQLYEAIQKIIDNNRKRASLTAYGETKLYSGTDSDAEDLAATPKAVKGLKTLIDALTRNLTNYIPNSKKSNAV
ncbi:tail fiber protein, partial [[Pasteurella] aerogenes]